MLRLKAQEGFGLVEAMVATVILTIGALAMATTLAGGALLNNQASTRAQTLALVSEQLDRVRSMEYKAIGLAPHGTTSASDQARTQSDWLTDFCPLQDTTQFPQKCLPSGVGSRMVTLTSLDYSATVRPNNGLSGTGFDPRRAKITQQADINAGESGASTVQQNGIVLYTYVYWGSLEPSSSPFRKDFKVIMVIGRFKDPVAGTTTPPDIQKYASVRMSAVVSDNPGVNLEDIPPQ